ncbi:MFS transporter [Labrys neptuniae]
MSLGVTVVQLDVAIVNVALEQMQALAGPDVASLQWVVNGYTLAFAGLQLTAGRLGDLYGVRRIFLLGIGIFTLASLACGIAPTAGLLIAARILQGIGAALLLPCSLALLTHTYLDPSERARAIGMWGAAGGLALASGPVVGGLLVATFGWRSIFLVNLPVGVLTIWLALRFTRETESSGGRSLDLPGQALAIVFLVAVTAVIIEGAPLGWHSPAVLGGMLIGLAGGLGFLIAEARSPSPMLPLGFFRNPVFSAVVLVGSLISFSFYGATFLLSLYFQNVLGMSVLQTGLAFVPMMGLIGLVNILSGRIAERWGTRPPILIGLVASVVGYALFAFAVAGHAAYAGLWPALMLIGAGTALTIPPLTAAMMETTERSRAGVAAGAFNALRQTGGAMGVAVFGVIGPSVAGIGSSMTIGAICLLAAFCAAACFIRPSRRSR